MQRSAWPPPTTAGLQQTISSQPRKTVMLPLKSFVLLPAAVCFTLSTLGVSIARAQKPGALVASFNPQAGAELASGDDAQVDAVVEQTSNKILVGGHFDTFAGVSREGIARLNSDGSLDMSFDPGTGALQDATPPSGYVNSLALQSNQDILVAGTFTTFNGTPTPGLVRLKPDGTLDTSFVPDIPADGLGAVVTVQTDGKILVAYTLQTGTNYYITRLKPDGARDTSFAEAIPVNNQINVLTIAADGKILVGGFFSQVHGVTRSFLARLNANGSLDDTFESKIVSADTTTYGSVYVIIEQPDGKILVGGHFTSVGHDARGSVARLEADGGLDVSFDPGTALAGYKATTFLYSAALQADGAIVLGGRFLTVDGVARKDIARLDANGTLDHTFGTSAGANYSVDAVLLQANGDFIIGGYFTTYQGKIRHGVARLY